MLELISWFCFPLLLSKDLTLAQNFLLPCFVKLNLINTLGNPGVLDHILILHNHGRKGRINSVRQLASVTIPMYCIIKLSGHTYQYPDSFSQEGPLPVKYELLESMSDACW